MRIGLVCAIIGELAKSRIFTGYRYNFFSRLDSFFYFLKEVFRKYYRPDVLIGTKFARVASDMGTGESAVLATMSIIFNGGVSRNLPAEKNARHGRGFCDWFLDLFLSAKI